LAIASETGEERQKPRAHHENGGVGLHCKRELGKPTTNGQGETHQISEPAAVESQAGRITWKASRKLETI